MMYDDIYWKTPHYTDTCLGSASPTVTAACQVPRLLATSTSGPGQGAASHSTQGDTGADTLSVASSASDGLIIPFGQLSAIRLLHRP